MRRPSVFVVPAILLVTIVLFAAYCATGDYPVKAPSLLAALAGEPSRDPLGIYVVEAFRLPRAIAGWLVGTALGLAGAITQAILQNPIAEPGTLGINTGASFTAILFLLSAHYLSSIGLSIAAFLGACLSIAFVVMFAKQGKAVALSSLRLIVSGILVSLIFSAGILAAITFGDVFSLQEALRWLLGSLADVTWASVLPIGCIVLVGGFATILASRVLQAHSLGDRQARLLGARTWQERTGLLFLAAALAGSAVATAGPIAFVGLLAPAAARSLHRPIDKRQLLLSALIGGLVMLAADLLGRLLVPGIEVACGLVTAILGAPVLLLLLSRRKRFA